MDRSQTPDYKALFLQATESKRQVEEARRQAEGRERKLIIREDKKWKQEGKEMTSNEGRQRIEDAS